MTRHLKPSSFLVVTTLRLRHSWTSWRRKREMARLTRRRQKAEQRVLLLTVLLQEQTSLANDLELRLGMAPPVLTVADLQPEEQPPAQVLTLTPGRPEPLPLVAQMEPLLQEELATAEEQEPMPDPLQELGQRLGLPPQRI